jgi:hypothetical protein
MDDVINCFLLNSTKKSEGKLEQIVNAKIYTYYFIFFIEATAQRFRSKPP